MSASTPEYSHLVSSSAGARMDDGGEIDVIADRLGDDRVIPVLDRGFVALVDCMPRMVPATRRTADHAVVQAARVSYGSGLKSPKEDVSTLRFMMRHRHTSPFEHVAFRFHVKAPLFVLRQWHRHRTWSYNELSGRYSEMEDEFFVPEERAVTTQSLQNKQGGTGEAADNAAERLAVFRNGQDVAFADYQSHLAAGVRKELARINLPLSTYTQMHATVDLHNLLHFLSLRCDSHAQEEIRVYAEAMLKLITPIVPETVRAWEDYHPMRQAVLLSRLEAEALGWHLRMSGLGVTQPPVLPRIDSDNRREQEEWRAKAARLGAEVAPEPGERPPTG